jgi:hypothetical protein
MFVTRPEQTSGGLAHAGRPGLPGLVARRPMTALLILVLTLASLPSAGSASLRAKSAGA